MLVKNTSEMEGHEKPNLIKIGWKIIKLSRFENIKTAFMGATILNI